jgi:tetratricopeptide (TPR) repeat protein
MRPGAIWCSGVLIALLVGLPTQSVAAEDTPSLNKEIEFGVKMAQRGLWNEALFRFKRAAEVRPGDSKVLNNLAVAYEAIGQYENALLAYQEALKADSANRELKRNYSRFVEFYQAFNPANEEPEADPLVDRAAEQGAESEIEPTDEPPSSEGGQ